MSTIWQTLTTWARALTLPILRAIGRLLSALSQPLARAAAGVALIIAAVALAHDLGPATLSTSSHFKPTSVMTHWQQLPPASLTATRSFAAQRLPPWIWSAFTAPLTLPTFVIFTVVAAIFGFLGRRRRRVEIFVNV